jgi:hypothetical protein
MSGAAQLSLNSAACEVWEMLVAEMENAAAMTAAAFARRQSAKQVSHHSVQSTSSGQVQVTTPSATVIE